MKTIRLNLFFAVNDFTEGKQYLSIGKYDQ
jgi:hypothetical protein